MDYFSLFSLPPAFDIDQEALERKYFELQRQHHPDRAGLAATLESARVNDAYRCLRDPVARAQCLLRQNGIDVNSVKADPAILAEAMELRERGATAEEAARLKEEALSTLSVCFARADYPAAAQEMLRLQYLTKLAEEIRHATAATS